MSSTTATSDEETTAGNRPLRLKRRKVAIFFAYCGVGYQGMQKNPGAKTIEGDLEEALFFAGAIPEADRGCPKRFDWARSARTDKGVSAVGQVVSGRFYVDPPGFVERLSSHLPPQFKIFGYKRVTPSFNAKKFCDRRRYVYLLPVFALDPSCHRDRESVLASLGSENELAKCSGCSERGRKVIGLMGNKRDWENGGFVQSGISSNSCDALLFAGENEGTDAGAGISSNCNENENVECKDGSEVTKSESLVVEEEVREEKKSEFKYGEEERKRFNRILEYYEGTHNFHNFTTRIKPEDPSAKRYIVSFEANTTVTIDGIEFVKCEVIGQSFMLHQIRKLIGMAVSVMRGFVPESIFDRAFDQDFRINVPTAPEVGLYLDECFFTSYNNKWNNTHEEVSMKEYAEEAEEFKMKYIYSHVAQTELREGSVAVWLHSLNHRNYPDFRPFSDEVERAADDEVGRSADDQVKGDANDKVEKAVNDEVEERAADDEVGRSADDQVKGAADDQVRGDANDKVEKAVNDEVEMATNNDEVKRTAEGETVNVLSS
uniref:Pseudouridine synthase I TruA alpha/beta domain-containing protein n=2 Tax=Chenopodium quinoa TaxID=63459 RepID=A0A803LK67_CHEQI